MRTIWIHAIGKEIHVKKVPHTSPKSNIVYQIIIDSNACFYYLANQKLVVLNNFQYQTYNVEIKDIKFVILNALLNGSLTTDQ